MRKKQEEGGIGMSKNMIVTIGRQYGSGGAEVGKKLGEKLGLDVYDKEILRMTSNESGIRESYFHLADEKAGTYTFSAVFHSQPFCLC